MSPVARLFVQELTCQTGEPDGAHATRLNPQG
jgi:hypothetical protein